MTQDLKELSELFFSGKRHPYYIVAPPYKRASAGVVTLHVLCHLLNRLGYPAFLVIRPDVRGLFGYAPYAIHSALVTPLLTPEIALAHYAEGLTPITVYPETITGNPLFAPLVARYVLYYSGALGGDKTYPPEEYVAAFSDTIKQSLPHCDAVISFPVADACEWMEGRESGPRTKRYYYGEKYIRTFGGKVPEHIEKTSIRITRDQPDSLTRPELIEALQSAQYLYVFEDTAMIYEAVLAGCIPILIKNEHFSGLLGEQENGTHGIALDNTPDEIERARVTQELYVQKYRHWLETGLGQVRQFAAGTQGRASTTPYTNPVDVFLSIKLRLTANRLMGAPVVEKTGLGIRLLFVALRILREQGVMALMVKVRKCVRKAMG